MNDAGLPFPVWALALDLLGVAVIVLAGVGLAGGLPPPLDAIVAGPGAIALLAIGAIVCGLASAVIVRFLAARSR